MAVKALVFDIFGTVVDWRSSIIEQFQAFGQEKGLTVHWEAFVDDWKSCYYPGMDAVRAGKLPWTNVDGIYRKKLDALLGSYGVTGLSEAETIRLNRAWHRCKPWPDVVAGLTRLKARYVLSTLSNGDVACMVNIAKYSGLPWDCVLCAELFHHYKPDPEVYRGAIALLGWEPEEIMMVAAHNYDLRADRKPEEDWDVVVRDFGELATVMAT